MKNSIRKTKTKNEVGLMKNANNKGEGLGCLVFWVFFVCFLICLFLTYVQRNMNKGEKGLGFGRKKYNDNK